MQNFVLRFNPKGASESWVNCFIRQKGNDLVSKWSSGIDSRRYNADGRAKYKLYFDLVRG
jgi:hypothetical protein